MNLRKDHYRWTRSGPPRAERTDAPLKKINGHRERPDGWGYAAAAAGRGETSRFRALLTSRALPAPRHRRLFPRWFFFFFPPPPFSGALARPGRRVVHPPRPAVRARVKAGITRHGNLKTGRASPRRTTAPGARTPAPPLRGGGGGLNAFSPEERPARFLFLSFRPFLNFKRSKPEQTKKHDNS